jgi:hypothetical protein
MAGRVGTLLVASKGHDKKGFDHPCRIENTTGRGETPLVMFSVEHGRKGFPPSRRVCVKENTTGRGETPSCRVCVERNTTEKGYTPLVASGCEEDMAREGKPPLITSV